MIEEALKFLTLQALAAGDAKAMATVDPGVERVVIGGVVKDYPKPLPHRTHVVNRLDEIVRLAARFAEITTDGPTTCTVWYSENAVTLVLDDDARRLNKVVLPLVESEVLGKLRKVGSTKYDLKGFRRFVRVDLGPYLPEVALLGSLKKIEFSNGTTVKSEKTKDKESLGREVMATIRSDAQIPDNLTLQIPVWSTFGERDEQYPFRCFVEIDPMDCTCQLIPYPDEVQRVYGLALASVQDRLDALPETVPAYHGTP